MSQSLTTVAMRHAVLIQELGDFFAVLAQRGSIEPSLVIIPTPDAPAPINKTAALGAGYTEETVALMEKLPYVSKDANSWHPEIMGSTEPIDFTKCENEDDFKIWREFHDGLEHEDENGNEEFIPGSLVKLTEHHLYGKSLLYDTETCEMTRSPTCSLRAVSKTDCFATLNPGLLIDWENLENPDDIVGYAHVPARSPAEVLDPWIEGFRAFKYMHTPGGNLWDAKDSIYAPSEPPERYPPKEKTYWRAA